MAQALTGGPMKLARGQEPGRPLALAYVSPNDSDHRMTPDEAERETAGVKAQALATRAAQLPGHLGHEPAIGVWKGGIEPSQIHSFDSAAGLRQKAAALGVAANQKAVLAFNSDPAGDGNLHVVALPPGTKPAEAIQVANKHSVPYLTVLAHPDATRMHVVDFGDNLKPNVEAFAKELGGRVESSTRGKPDYIGHDDDRAEGQKILTAAMNEPPSDPVKLARRPTKRDITAGVDAQLTGSRLAFHLKDAAQRHAGNEQFQADVKNALAGKNWVGPGGGVFGRIGSFLKAAGDKLGSAYNWHRAGDSMTVDDAVKGFVEKGLTDKIRATGKAHAAVADHFGLSGKFAGQDPHAKFWDRLRSHVREKLGGVVDAKHMSDDRLDRSLRRLKYLEEDRAAVGDKGWQDYHALIPSRGSAEQLARPLAGLWKAIGNLVGKKPDSDRIEGLGGVVHQDAPRGAVERSAIARALQNLDVWHRDPKKWRALVDDYTRRAAKLRELMPNHPLVTHYTRVADGITAPEIKAGDGGDFKTVEPGGAIGEVLTQHVTPMIRFLAKGFGDLKDKQLPEKPDRPAPAPRPTRRRKVKVKGYDFAPEGGDTAEPTIREPAVGEGYGLKANEGELGEGGHRHQFIAQAHAAGKSRAEVLDGLRHEFFLTPRQAAGTYARYGKKPLSE